MDTFKESTLLPPPFGPWKTPHPELEVSGDEIEVMCPDSRTGEGVSVVAGCIWRQPMSACLQSVIFSLATCTRCGLVSPG